MAAATSIRAIAVKVSQRSKQGRVTDAVSLMGRKLPSA